MTTTDTAVHERREFGQLGELARVRARALHLAGVGVFVDTRSLAAPTVVDRGVAGDREHPRPEAVGVAQRWKALERAAKCVLNDIGQALGLVHTLCANGGSHCTDMGRYSEKGFGVAGPHGVDQLPIVRRTGRCCAPAPPRL